MEQYSNLWNIFGQATDGTWTKHYSPVAKLTDKLRTKDLDNKKPITWRHHSSAAKNLSQWYANKSLQWWQKLCQSGEGNRSTERHRIQRCAEFCISWSWNGVYGFWGETKMGTVYLSFKTTQLRSPWPPQFCRHCKFEIKTSFSLKKKAEYPVHILLKCRPQRGSLESFTR